MEQSTTDYVLTPQKAEFVRHLASGKSGRDAAELVGLSRSSGTASKWLSDENLRNALKSAAIEQGNTPESIAITLREAREANRVELDRFGNPVDLGPDHPSRIKAADVAIKMLGGYPKPGADIDLHAQNVLVIRAEQGLASSDPFSVEPSGDVNRDGIEVLSMPESLSESPLTRHDFDAIT